MSKNCSKSVGFKRNLGQKTQLPKSFGLKIEVQKNLGKKNLGLKKFGIQKFFKSNKFWVHKFGVK